MVKHFSKEDIEALNNLLTKDKRYVEYRSRGVCVRKPEIKCNKDHECIKMAEAYGNPSSRPGYNERTRNNAFAKFTHFFATSDPGFVCKDLEEKIKLEVNKSKW